MDTLTKIGILFFGALLIFIVSWVMARCLFGLENDETQVKRDMEDMLKQADKELKRRDRLIKGGFWK